MHAKPEPDELPLLTLRLLGGEQTRKIAEGNLNAAFVGKCDGHQVAGE